MVWDGATLFNDMQKFYLNYLQFIYSLGGDLLSLEELLSLEDLKTFKRHFLNAVKEKQDNLLKEKDFQLTTRNHQEFGMFFHFWNNRKFREIRAKGSNRTHFRVLKLRLRNLSNFKK